MYQTLNQESQYTYEEKKSEFIAFVFPIKDRADCLARLEALREEYPDARHHCWAYLIGHPEQPKTAAFNDDGEPSGTAGKPILHVLTQRGAGDCGAIVVRYFGGTKLGAGGLVRAYGQAISKALDNASWQDVVPMQTVTIRCGYEFESDIRHHIQQRDGTVQQQDYDHQVNLCIELPCEQLPTLVSVVTQVTAGQGIVKTNAEQ